MRFLAQVVSYLFHPLLMMTYAYIMLMYSNPFSFRGHAFAAAFEGNLMQFIRVLQMTFIFPAFAVLMMRFLGLVKSFEMRDREERYGPYIATGICYLWFFINLNWGVEGYPSVFTSFTLGATIGLFVAFFLNIFTKVSAHTTGVGGLVCMALYIYPQSYLVSPLWLVAVLLAAGSVGTARLLLKAHSPQEVYGGYLIGFGSQALAFGILG